MQEVGAETLCGAPLHPPRTGTNNSSSLREGPGEGDASGIRRRRFPHQRPTKPEQSSLVGVAEVRCEAACEPSDLKPRLSARATPVQSVPLNHPLGRDADRIAKPPLQLAQVHPASERSCSDRRERSFDRRRVHQPASSWASAGSGGGQSAKNSCASATRSSVTRLLHRAPVAARAIASADHVAQRRGSRSVTLAIALHGRQRPETRQA